MHALPFFLMLSAASALWANTGRPLLQDWVCRQNGDATKCAWEWKTPPPRVDRTPIEIQVNSGSAA